MREKCHKESLLALPTIGKKLPILVEEVDGLLRKLDEIASCALVCPGKNSSHHVQKLLGKTVSCSIASIELAYRGHYDESMILCRSVGEAANLSWLFLLDKTLLDNWMTLEPKKRWHKFKPGAVRKLIKDKGVPVPIDQSKYSSLSELGHPTPHASPNYYNSHLPTLGGRFQKDGLIVAINEIAGALSIVGMALPQFVEEIDVKYKAELVISCIEIIENIGGVDVSMVKGMY